MGVCTSVIPFVESEFLIRTQGSLILLAAQATPKMSLLPQHWGYKADVFSVGSEERSQVPTFVWQIL